MGDDPSTVVANQIYLPLEVYQAADHLITLVFINRPPRRSASQWYRWLAPL